MQWEVLHSVRCACSSSAKQGEQVERSNLLVTLCTAVRTSLRTVLTHIHGEHTATAHCQGVQMWDMEGGNWGTFQRAQEPGRRAPLSEVKASHKPTSSAHHQGCHLGTLSLHSDTAQMHHNTVPWSVNFDNWISFKGVKGNWFLAQRTCERTPEKEENHLTLLTFCEMEHHQEALLWDSLRKDKATPYKAVTPSAPCTQTQPRPWHSHPKAHGWELGWAPSRQPSQEPHQNMPTRKHSTLLL